MRACVYRETEAQRRGATAGGHTASAEPGPESRLPGPFSVSQSACLKRDRERRRLDSPSWAEGVQGADWSESREGRGVIPGTCEERPVAWEPEPPGRGIGPGFTRPPEDPGDDGHVTGLVAGSRRWWLRFLFLCRDVSPQGPPSSGGRKRGRAGAGRGWGSSTFGGQALGPRTL